jgi:hypothetical protein
LLLFLIETTWQYDCHYHLAPWALRTKFIFNRH